MIFKEAVEKLEKETKKAIETESVTSYDNEMEDEEVYTCIIDTKKNIVERISEDVSEEADYYYFNVKEKDGYGVYVNDRLTDGKWKHYKEELEAMRASMSIGLENSTQLIRRKRDTAILCSAMKEKTS